MSTTVKRKLCWNCEGSVTRDAANCPYCGVYLHPKDDDGYEDIEDHRPPYAIPEEQENTVPEAPYAATREAVIENKPEKTPLQIMKAQSADWKIVVLPLAMLLAGSLSLLFGVLLLLFSHNGTFTLQWNASYWVYYLVASIPLLFMGWKSLQEE